MALAEYIGINWLKHLLQTNHRIMIGKKKPINYLSYGSKVEIVILLIVEVTLLEDEKQE